MVVRRDLDAARLAVEDGLVDATVPEGQFVGAEAERPTEQLIAEADAEERQARAQHALQQFHVRLARRGVAGPVGVEDGHGLEREEFGERRRLRQHVHLEAARRELPQRRLLHPEVEHGESADRLTHRGDDGRGRHGDLARQVAAEHAGRLLHEGELLSRVKVGVVAREDASTHDAGISQAARDRPRVDAADAHDAVGDEVVIETARRSIVRDHARGVAHDEAVDPDAPGFDVLVVHARVADVGGGHDDELAGVARVGQRLLVPAHAGGEDRLAECAAPGAVGAALVAGSVFQDEDGGRGSHVGLPSGVAAVRTVVVAASSASLRSRLNRR